MEAAGEGLPNLDGEDDDELRGRQRRRKRARREDVAMTSERVDPTPEMPPGTILLSELCDEVAKRLTDWTDEVLFNALELLLDVPNDCVPLKIKFNARKLDVGEVLIE